MQQVYFLFWIFYLIACLGILMVILLSQLFLVPPYRLVLCGFDLLMHASTTMSGCNRFLFDNMFQIQHPRSHLNRFDMVITPRHDYYPLTPHAQEQIPWFLRRWITPREPPGKNVVCIEYFLKWLICDGC